MTQFTIIPDNEVPNARSRARKNKANPLDVELAAFLKANPRKWVEYPAAKVWPHLDQTDKDGLRNAARYVSQRLCYGRPTKTRGHFGGAFAVAPEDGRFVSRIDRDHRRVLVSFIPAESR